LFADTAEETADSPLVSCPGESCTTRSFFPFPRQAGNARAMRAIHPPQRQRRCCGGRVVKRSRRPEEIGGSLTDIGDKMTDFLVTACLVKHLDLLISVDTAPAHLAGALHWPSPCGRCCRLCPTGAGCANARTRRGTRQCAFSGKNPAATGKAYSRMWGVCWPGLPPHLRAHSEIFCYSPQAYDLQSPENSGAASAMAVLRAVARPRRYRHETFSKRYNSRDSQPQTFSL